MDGNTVISLIQGVGFPIAACIAMAWYVKYITDKNREDINKLHDQHREEMKQVTEALNNNTLALQQLTDNLEGIIENGRED